ncbi:MAG: FAD-binding oxidoreductase [Myxococcota bacterium]
MRLALLTVESNALDLSALQAEGLVAAGSSSPEASKATSTGTSNGTDENLSVQSYCPSTPEEVAEIVAAAATDEASLLVTGAGTRMHWANPMQRVAAGLSLSGLSGVTEFEPDEGVLKALAGTTIAEIQARAAEEGWELPLDPPLPGTSTVGGTIASAATGPRAHLLGSVSDAILGLDLVSAEGVASKCGGRVVKNVTGYDLAKLHCGAFGTLGVITSAWLRLRPRPESMKTLEATLPISPENFALCRKLAKQKSVRAFVWAESGESGESRPSEAKIAIEWGGSSEGVDHDQSEAQAALSGLPGVSGSGSLLLREADPSIVDTLRDQRAQVDEGSDAGVVLRARVLGTRAFEMTRSLAEAGLSVSVDVGLGVVDARGELAGASALLELRRVAEEFSGHLFVESMPGSWRGEVDAFGAAAGTSVLMETLKKRFDPGLLLNPGRFVTGDADK